MASSASSKLILKQIFRRSWGSRGRMGSQWLRPTILEGNATVLQSEQPSCRPPPSTFTARPPSQYHHWTSLLSARSPNSAICGSILGRVHNGLPSDNLSEDAQTFLAPHTRSAGAYCMTFSRIAHSNAKTPDASQSAGPDNENPEGRTNSTAKSLGSRVRTLLSGLEQVPVAALGLGLAGAIPFVGLTPGIATLLPLPVALLSIHTEAQAAYGAVILTFLGGPHWGLAMTDYGRPTASSISRQTIQTIRYVWSVVPSLIAWPALLLDPVPKFALLIVSFGLVLGVDATFARLGLVPPWYMPLRVLLTGIAMLSMMSSLIVTAAASVTIH